MARNYEIKGSVSLYESGKRKQESYHKIRQSSAARSELSENGVVKEKETNSP